MNNLWNICRTKSGKLISGGWGRGVQIRNGKSDKKSKINKRRGLLFGTEEYGLMDPVNVLENVHLDILKKVMPTVPFSATANGVPYF